MLGVQEFKTTFIGDIVYLCKEIKWVSYDPHTNFYEPILRLNDENEVHASKLLLLQTDKNYKFNQSKRLENYNNNHYAYEPHRDFDEPFIIIGVKYERRAIVEVSEEEQPEIPTNYATQSTKSKESKTIFIENEWIRQTGIPIYGSQFVTYNNVKYNTKFKHEIWIGDILLSRKAQQKFIQTEVLKTKLENYEGTLLEIVNWELLSLRADKVVILEGFYSQAISNYFKEVIPSIAPQG